jgi:Protein of unknown function (DUF4019)
LGDALTECGAQIDARHQTGGAIVRRRWLIGGTAMTLALAVYALAALSGPAADPAAPADISAGSPASAGQVAAIDAARAFLSLVDAGDWISSYAATARAFRQINSEPLWTQSSQNVYPPLGLLRSRTLAGADFVPAPPNGEWIVKFRSSFANRASAIETLSLVREDGALKVVGIFVD